MGQAILLSVLKIVMILICSGWVSLWVLKPTRMWTRKWKEAEDALRPSFLGYYGLDFLVFTFPVISVAILGSIYMSVTLKKPKIRKAISGLSNPVIVNTLVGTLSAMEILSISLFFIFLVWTYYIRIANDFKKLVPIKTLSLETWQLKYLRVATRFGLLSEACLALLLLPILRGLSVFNLIGVRFEASVRYHVWLGTAMILFSTIHGLSTLFIWGVSHHISDEIWKWQPKGRIYLAGEMGLVTGLVIWITSLPQIRRRKFEIFYYTHHLYVVFLLLFLFHAGDRHFYSVFGGIFLFGLDKLLRIVQSRPGTHILSAKIFPCKAIELVLPKDPEVKYRPTSMVFVKIPKISNLQWHSFSVTSSSSIDQLTMSVIIKCQGSWTNSLFEMINSELKSGSDTTNTIEIAVEGPYGPASTNFLGYESLILIAGGVGVTPFLSIVQELASSPKNSSIELIYVVKKSQDICLLSSISHLLSHRPSERFGLKLRVYVTQEQRSGTTLRELLNKFSHVETVGFGAEATSVHKIDGPESFGSKAFVTGLSSASFLAFLVCFNHVFAPSLNEKSMKEAKEKTPSSAVDLVIIGSFVSAMAVASLVAVVLRRRRSKRRSVPSKPEKRRVESQQGSSVESGFGLEGHELHFIGRPNFQDIFSEFESEAGGSDIGVLVCGPKAMKESVGRSCQRNSRSFVNIVSEAKKKRKTSFSFHSLSFDL